MLYSFASFCIVFLLTDYCTAQNDTCSVENPIYDCFQSMTTEISTIDPNTDRGKFCSILQKYVSCVEDVACQCDLENSAMVLQALTYYIGVYKQNGCEHEASGDLVVEPGVKCPGKNKTGSFANEGLLVLALDTVPAVVSLDQDCPGIRQCYANYSNHAEQALYNKDLEDMCIGIEILLPCLEKSVCACNEANNALILQRIITERNNYKAFCGILIGDVVFEDGINCQAVEPVSVCKAANPTLDCYNTYAQSVNNNFADLQIVCPAIETFINCSESVACECGLRKSIPILHSLTIQTANHRVMGCSAVTGDLTVTPGIQCPVDFDVNGTNDDEVLLSIGILNAAGVMGIIDECPATKSCYIQVDSQTASALHHKDAAALCQSQSSFIHCLEQATCDCGKYHDEQFQSWLMNQKSQHLTICAGDRSINTVFTCEFCLKTNPIYDCYVNLQRLFNKTQMSTPEWCNAIHDYVNCAENVGCTCGIENSKRVLQSLSYYIHLYKKHVCFIYAERTLPEDPGVKCPNQNVTGTDEEKAMLVLSLDTVPDVVNLDRTCPGVAECYKQFSDNGGRALYKKDIQEFCRYHEEFLACYESTVCECEKSTSSEVVFKINAERNDYNDVCSPITRKKYEAGEINCKKGDVVSVCQIANPFAECEARLSAVLSSARATQFNKCTEYRIFIACMEAIACKCGLRNSVNVYKALTLIIKIHNDEQCSSVTGPLSIVSGIPCTDDEKGEGNAEDDKILTLGILQAPVAVKHVQICSTAKACYEESEKNSIQALYNKDAKELCRYHGVFVSCVIEAMCECGLLETPDFKNWTDVQAEEHKINCNPDTPIIMENTCSGCSVIVVGSFLSTFVFLLHILITII